MEKDRTLPQKKRVTRRKAETAASPGEKVDGEMRQKMIAQAAYYRFQRRGSGNGGDHVEDWLQAEAEIDALLGRHS